MTVFEKRAELRPSAKSRRNARAKVRAEAELAAAASAGSAPTAMGEEAAPAAPEDDREAEEVAEEEEDDDAGEVEAVDDADADASAPPTVPQPPKNMRTVTREYEEVSKALPDEWLAVAAYYGLDSSMAGRLFLRGTVQRQVYLMSEGAASLLRCQTRLPTRMVLSGVLALQRSLSHHIDACPWQLEQDGLLAMCAQGLTRRVFFRRPLFRRLLVERELTLTEVESAAAAGEARGLGALAKAPAGGDGTQARLRPGSLAVQLLPEEGEAATSNFIVVAARISDDCFELAAKNVEVASLLEDLDGQPSVDDILGAPAPAAEAEAESLEEKPQESADAMAVEQTAPLST